MCVTPDDAIGSANRMRFTMRVHPFFDHGEMRANTPQPEITTLWLPGAASNQTGAFIRLLDFGLNPAGQSVGCLIDVDNNDSTVVLTFDYFGQRLDYDPGKPDLDP